MRSMSSGLAPPHSQVMLHGSPGFGVDMANDAVLLRWGFLINVSACLQGACMSGSQTMLVMEFVEGGDLWRNLQRPGTRVGNWRLHGRKVALDIARGLCFLHAHSIV